MPCPCRSGYHRTDPAGQTVTICNKCGRSWPYGPTLPDSLPAGYGPHYLPDHNTPTPEEP